MAGRRLLELCIGGRARGPYVRSSTLSPFRAQWMSTTSEEEAPHLFDKLLVANRGEIACRVFQTAQRMGIKTVAVFSEADCNARHVTMADEAYCIGPAPSGESYLRGDRIMEVARNTGAEAIHPGYGFLSENNGFASLCQSEGVEFIGPPPEAIQKMGIKRVSKQIMSQSSVPIVPGYFGDDQSDSLLQQEANQIGYPVMIKADLGGGGKGMRVVSKPEDFQSALDACRREALKSFGDDKVLIEKFVERPRHVEIQIFADKHGNTVHLFERDCSVQRRHQKIIEEAPAPGLSPEVREQMWTTAVRAAQAVGYVGAGTVEFVMDKEQNFYFMEMNTRLQVEHPITEMITGTDLVEWQIRVAAGEPLPVKQNDLSPKGHAFEARIYAEDPISATDFLPSPGFLHHLQAPPTSPHVRVDTGVRQGDEVSSHYDPMIAKLVVWGADRHTALLQLRRSLPQYQIAGVSTNIDFLQRLVAHKSFENSDVHTGFIPQHQEVLFSHLPLSKERVTEATLALLAYEQWKNFNLQRERGTGDPFSLFSDSHGWRLNITEKRVIVFSHQNNSYRVGVLYNGDGTWCIVEDLKEHQEGVANWSEQASSKASGFISEREGEEGRGGRGGGGGGCLVLEGIIDGRKLLANIAVSDSSLHIFSKDGGYSVDIPQPEYMSVLGPEDAGGDRSPKYPSVVTKVFIKPGDSVTKGMTLMTVEAMKVEFHILAGKDGVVKEILYKEQDNVDAFSKVVVFNDE